MESALLYAKAWSKYTKELLAWVEKRLSIGQTQQEWQIFRETTCIFRSPLNVGRPQGGDEDCACFLSEVWCVSRY